MRLRDIFLTGLCLLLVPGFGSAAGARDAGTLTKIESRKLPAAEVKRRTLEQLSRILILDPYPATDVPPKLPLSDLSFWTKPRETSIPGLCATDSVTVNFRPAKLPLKGAETPTFAEGIQAKTAYRFAVLPKDSHIESRATPLGKDNPDCAKINPSVDQTFSARDEDDAVEGVWLVGEIERQAAKGNPSFALKCDFGGPDANDRCIKALNELKQTDVSIIERCERAENETGECLRIWMWNQQVSLDVIVDNGKIVRVAAGQVVTVSDQRAD